jgi:hypothetical protein
MEGGGVAQYVYMVAERLDDTSNFLRKRATTPKEAGSMDQYWT